MDNKSEFSFAEFDITISDMKAINTNLDEDAMSELSKTSKKTTTIVEERRTCRCNIQMCAALLCALFVAEVVFYLLYALFGHAPFDYSSVDSIPDLVAMRAADNFNF